MLGRTYRIYEAPIYVNTLFSPFSGNYILKYRLNLWRKKIFSLLNTYKAYVCVCVCMRVCVWSSNITFAQGICVLTNVENFSRGILIINGEIIWGTIFFFTMVQPKTAR